MANTKYQFHQLARYTYDWPTYHLLAANPAPPPPPPSKNKGNTKKLSLEKTAPVERNFWKVCMRLGQKEKEQKGEDRRSSRATQNNKRTDRKMESTDNLEIPDRWKDIKSVRHPFGPRNSGVLRDDLESMKYIWDDQKARNKTKDKKSRHNKKWPLTTSHGGWGLFVYCPWLHPTGLAWRGFGESEEHWTRKAEMSRLVALAVFLCSRL